jgi:phospholipid transport system substrate-binding protein
METNQEGAFVTRCNNRWGTALVTFAILLLGATVPLGGVRASADDATSPPATRAAGGPAEDQEPSDAALATPAVEKLHATLIEIMKRADTLGYSGRFDRLSPVVSETFDLPFMAAKSVGQHWKTLPDADQQRWLELFARHITANYAGQFTGFGGEGFETLGEEPAIRDTRVVRTRLTRPDDEDVQLNYRLREVDGEWRIIDIYLNGTVSELALRRSEYSSVLKREGFEKLVSTIAEKCRELESESTPG